MNISGESATEVPLLSGNGARIGCGVFAITPRCGRRSAAHQHGGAEPAAAGVLLETIFYSLWLDSAS